MKRQHAGKNAGLAPQWTERLSELSPAAPQAAAAPAASGVPSEPFGTYAAPEGMGRRRGIASRQLLPMLASWAAVAGTAVALAIYFANH